MERKRKNIIKISLNTHTKASLVSVIIYNDNNFVKKNLILLKSETVFIYFLNTFFNHGYISVSDRGRSRGDTPPDHKMSDQSDDEFDTGQGQAVSRIMSNPFVQKGFIDGMGSCCTSTSKNQHDFSWITLLQFQFNF